MSEIFHQSCYTSRSTGYKYRTLATNTGERKHRDQAEDTVFDKKFSELKRAIFSRIDKELSETQKSREMIMAKLDTVTSKIDSMINVSNEIMRFRKSVYVVENTLADMATRVNRLDIFTQPSEECCVKSLNEDICRARTEIFQKEPHVANAIFTEEDDHVNTGSKDVSPV